MGEFKLYIVIEQKMTWLCTKVTMEKNPHCIDEGSQQGTVKHKYSVLKVYNHLSDKYIRANIFKIHVVLGSHGH